MARRPQTIRINSEQHIRIKKLKTISLIQEICATRVGEASKINSVINDALEIGLPCLLESTNPVSLETSLEKYTQRIITNQNRQTQKLQSTLQKLSVLATINEAMVGTIIHELESLLQVNGVELPPELLEEFKQEIPQRFEAEKVKLIEKLLRTNNTEN